MKASFFGRIVGVALGVAAALPAAAQFDGSLDPESVVEAWSNSSEYTKIIDIDFTDDTWPCTWAGTTSVDCPSYSDGGYVNAVIETAANGGSDVTYPVLFHHCTFSNSESYNGYGCTTAAFARQYYNGSSATNYNTWSVEGHTTYLEDNITYDTDGTTPVFGQAGFVQMCRDAATTDDPETSMHGWMEIDHIPYVDRVQWSWSSTSWGRGIKCDVKVGDGDWEPLVWMGSEKHKSGYTIFSDQGYFMENVVEQSDVSLRWRVWDGDDETTLVQVYDDGTSAFSTAIDPLVQKQAPRVHKIQIFGSELTSSDAENARENQIGDVGDLSDLSEYESSGDDTDSSSESTAPTNSLLAFPTAEGFGKYASGGRGGQVVTVTSLEDDESVEGTLRWAFNQYDDEPLTIVFAVSGEIALQSELKVSRADWTLAGQTAPGEGIVITHNKVNLGGSENFIVRNVRFRIGQMDASGEIIAENALGCENCYNFIIDHCVFGWSVEENINTADSHFLTVQYSLVHEGLYNAGHSKGARGYASQWGGSPATYHHNLLAHNYNRSPRFNGARGEDYVVFMEYANNVNYNFGKVNSCYGGENTADITTYNGLNSAHECNFMNNYYKSGPATPTGKQLYFLESSYARDGATSWGPAQWYVNGNVLDGDDAATQDNWVAVSAETYSLDDINAGERITTATPYYKYSVTGNAGTYTPELYMLDSVQTATDAYYRVLNTAGTINRDEIEKRIVNEVYAGTSTYVGSAAGGLGIIDLETDAEGFYTYSTDWTAPTDTDGDGMPDEWESANNLDPLTADQNTISTDGYTALEVYLNGLMAESDTVEFSSVKKVYYKLGAQDISFDSSTGTLTVSEAAVGCLVRAYTSDGRMVASQRITATSIQLDNLPRGLLLLQITGNDICPRVLKVVQ